LNKLVKKLYVAIRYDDRRVVHFDTNLSSFINGCQEVANISNMKGLSYYQYTFKEQETIHHIDSFGKMYYLQKIL